MNAKEDAYNLLRQWGVIPESILRKKLLEKYSKVLVDFLLLEMREEDSGVICIPVEHEKYNIKDRLLILIGAWDEKKEIEYDEDEKVERLVECLQGMGYV